jgi:iron complex transport system substrate-binding protein
MRRAVAALVIWLALSSGAAAAPSRIVSLNLCADILLVALVPPARIAGLSRNATDPELSPIVEIAATLPLVGQNVEAVLGRDPDLVVVSRYGAAPTKALLRRIGLRTHEVGAMASFRQFADELRELGATLEARDTAEALIARMEARLAAIARPVAPTAPAALAYGPRGATEGAGSLLDEVIALAGLRNRAAELGFGAWGTLPLEMALRARPDMLVLEGHAESHASRARDLIRHPAFRHLKPPPARIVVPGSALLCAGPATIDAVGQLVAAAKR